MNVNNNYQINLGTKDSLGRCRKDTLDKHLLHDRFNPLIQWWYM